MDGDVHDPSQQHTDGDAHEPSQQHTDGDDQDQRQHHTDGDAALFDHEANFCSKFNGMIIIAVFFRPLFNL